MVLLKPAAFPSRRGRFPRSTLRSSVPTNPNSRENTESDPLGLDWGLFYWYRVIIRETEDSDSRVTHGGPKGQEVLSWFEAVAIGRV